MNVMMIGTFGGPMCGELACNQQVYNAFENSPDIQKVLSYNSGISDGVEAPGVFGVRKLISALKVLFFSCLKSRGYDCVYITPGLSFLGVLRFVPLILILKISNKKVVVHYHGGRLPQLYQRSGMCFRWLIRVGFGLPDHHIFLTERLMLAHKNIHDIKKYSVVGNFVDDEFFRPARLAQKPIGDGGVEILFLSNLIEDKGVLILVEAFERLRSANLSCNLTIAGNGSRRDILRLKGKISSSKFSEYIKFIGPVYGREKVDVFRNSDIFVLPTSYPQEAMPLVILEAMVSGCVVVSTNIGGIADIIDHQKTGILMESPAVGEVVKAVSRIIEEDGLISAFRKEQEKIIDRYRRKRFDVDIVSAVIN